MIRIPKPALQLGLFALLSASLLAGLHTLTRGTIHKNRTLHTAKLLAQVIPATDTPPLEAKLLIDHKQQALWQAYAEEQVVAVALVVTAKDGYSGDIELLVGVDKQNRISGVRVTKHRETPGLGDKIDRRRSDWIDTFIGLSLKQPNTKRWAVKKDGGVFDQFTGATITPRAIVKSVHNTLVYSQKHHVQLFSRPPQKTQP